jgi:hypothetical protein
MSRALYRLFEATGNESYRTAADRYALFLINALHDPPTPFTNTIEIAGERRTSLSSSWMYGKALAPCYEEFCKHDPKEDFLERKALTLYRWLQRHRRDDSYFGVGYPAPNVSPDCQNSCDLGEVGYGLMGYYAISKRPEVLQDAVGLAQFFLTEYKEGSGAGIWSPRLGVWLVSPWIAFAEHQSDQTINKVGWGWSAYLDSDYLRFNAEKLYGGKLQDLDERAFRAWVEALPCCVLGGDRKTAGDPLNVVIVGERQAVFLALARRGWNATEAITLESSLRIAESSVFGSRYRYGPVSPLYVFGRAQDVAFQKARASAAERTHMRLWMAPVKASGATVWVGQISRDIGVRLSSRTVTTHKIDPEVDETRWYLNQDLLYSHSLRRHAHATGVGAATIENPRVNYTGDPYWTDGLRLVMWLSAEPVSYHQVETLPWEVVPAR